MKARTKILIPVTFMVTAGLALVGLGLVCYYYETMYTGLLPVVSYPYRVYALPVSVTGAILLLAGLLVLLLMLRRR